jgi:3-hydroxyphenylacetate 6-hydroxylase
MLQTVQNALQADQSFQNVRLAILSLISIVLVVYELIRWFGRIRGFSGPMGLPVVGNLLQIQGKDAPEQYRVWSKTYGSVYQIALGSIPVLVINSAAAAKALFIQNSQACASRPEFYTFHKVSTPV